ncbi:Extracellular serine protease [Pandoraea iniqua]|uniref:autotransporter outer membrane beta-barrel domain-containing protein n=1 Tax=Pandoraea iniqua TaxID=2508288 RepID=UPI001255DF04|nr:autotransporter outer membrane beta-barrel domain-containing protein [Pandoraea iniqua]VVE43780.1 Extracellular serine protease [Pandoraea iniqua]
MKAVSYPSFALRVTGMFTAAVVLFSMAVSPVKADEAAEMRNTLIVLSGAALLNNAVTAQSAASAFQRAMQTRTMSGGVTFDDTTGKGLAPGNGDLVGWASFTGERSHQNGETRLFDVRGVNGAIGVDSRIDANTIVGGSLGVGNHNSEIDGHLGEAGVNSVSLGVYASHLSDQQWFVNGGATYTNHSVKTDRNVDTSDASPRVKGNTRGNTFGAFGEMGRRNALGAVHLDSTLGMRFLSTRLNAFDEAGGGDASAPNALKVGSQSRTSTRGIVGVRLWHELVNVAGGKAIPSLRVAYEYEFGDKRSSLTNAFYGATRSFTVQGAKLGAHIVTAELGVDVQFDNQLEVHVGGNMSARRGETTVGGGIGAKYRF